LMVAVLAAIVALAVSRVFKQHGLAASMVDGPDPAARRDRFAVGPTRRHPRRAYRRCL
jgi:hypothetical protein